MRVNVNHCVDFITKCDVAVYWMVNETLELWQSGRFNDKNKSKLQSLNFKLLREFSNL